MVASQDTRSHSHYSYYQCRLKRCRMGGIGIFGGLNKQLRYVRSLHAWTEHEHSRQHGWRLNNLLRQRESTLNFARKFASLGQVDHAPYEWTGILFVNFSVSDLEVEAPNSGDAKTLPD